MKTGSLAALYISADGCGAGGEEGFLDFISSFRTGG